MTVREARFRGILAVTWGSQWLLISHLFKGKPRRVTTYGFYSHPQLPDTAEKGWVWPSSTVVPILCRRILPNTNPPNGAPHTHLVIQPENLGSTGDLQVGGFRSHAWSRQKHCKHSLCFSTMHAFVEATRPAPKSTIGAFSVTHSLADNDSVTRRGEIDALLAIDGDGSETPSFVFPSLVS